MVLTISGLCLCFIPGLFGWIGILLAAVGITIGIVGLTTPKTSPSGLGMDVASWVYGIGTTITGFGFQIIFAAGGLDSILLPISMNIAAIITVSLIPIFVGVQIFARKKYRMAGIAIAMVLYVTIAAFGWTYLVLAHRAGIVLT